MEKLKTISLLQIAQINADVTGICVNLCNVDEDLRITYSVCYYGPQKSLFSTEQDWLRLFKVPVPIFSERPESL